MESDERSGGRQRCGGCQNAAAGCLHLREARVRWSMRAMELGSKGAPGVGADGSARRELERLGGRGGDLCVREALAGGRARGEIRARARPLSERRGCLGPRGRGCDLCQWEREKLGGKDTSARATEIRRGRKGAMERRSVEGRG